jgi:hypothetical protein
VALEETVQPTIGRQTVRVEKHEGIAGRSQCAAVSRHCRIPTAWALAELEDSSPGGTCDRDGIVGGAVVHQDNLDGPPARGLVLYGSN